MKHDWFNPYKAGYKNLGNYDSCRKCGVVRNINNTHKENCRGKVRIELRG